MSNKKRRWELRLGSKVDSLTLRFQTTKLFFFDSVPNFHLRHWHRLNSSWCVCVWSRYWSDPIDSQCQVQTVYESVLVVHICVGSRVQARARERSHNPPSEVQRSVLAPLQLQNAMLRTFPGMNSASFFLPFIWFHCAAVKEVNKSCLQRQNSQREKEKDNLISSRLTRLSCHRLSGKDLRVENRKESDASELFSLSLTVSHFHDGL